MAGCRPVACPATVPPQRPTALRPLRGAKPGRSAIDEPGLPHATAGRGAQQPRAISYLVVTGCAFWWCIMVRYRRCTWQFGSPRYDTPSPPQQSSSLWPAIELRSSFDVTCFWTANASGFGYCTMTMDSCLPTAPQSWYPAEISIYFSCNISSYPSVVHLQLLCMPLHLPIFLLVSLSSISI